MSQESGPAVPACPLTDADRKAFRVLHARLTSVLKAIPPVLEAVGRLDLMAIGVHEVEEIARASELLRQDIHDLLVTGGDRAAGEFVERWIRGANRTADTIFDPDLLVDYAVFVKRFADAEPELFARRDGGYSLPEDAQEAALAAVARLTGQ